MNKEMLENIMMFNHGIEELNSNLFEKFLSDLEDLHELVSKEKDPLFSKEETIKKVDENEKLANTLRDLFTIVKMDLSKKTLLKLLKEGLSKNIAATSYFSIFNVINKSKFSQKDQEDIFKILSEELKKEPKETLGAVLFINLLASCRVINPENIIKSKADFKFNFFHEYNKNELIKFNDLSNDKFLLYIINQFKSFNLYKPMSLEKNDISLEDAVKPYLEQNLNQDKKELLVYFLVTIRDKLKLDNTNNQFLDKLQLNLKLSQLNENDLIKKVKKNKI